MRKRLVSSLFWSTSILHSWITSASFPPIFRMTMIEILIITRTISVSHAVTIEGVINKEIAPPTRYLFYTGHAYHEVENPSPKAGYMWCQMASDCACSTFWPVSSSHSGLPTTVWFPLATSEILPTSLDQMLKGLLAVFLPVRQWESAVILCE